jgi:hypothetical protein
MQSAILAKLQEKLAGPPEDEANVVYVLVEIRKYLDHIDPNGSKYAVLRTYCDWPVHIRLHRSGAKSLLRSLDDAFAAKHTQAERNEAMKTAFEQFSLTQFKNELRLFLQSENLPLTLVDNPACWGQFLKHFVAVVSDCPFVFVGAQTHTRAIKRATLEINEQTQSLQKSMQGVVSVVWSWRLELADGTTLRISNTFGYRIE